MSISAERPRTPLDRRGGLCFNSKCKPAYDMISIIGSRLMPDPTPIRGMGNSARGAPVSPRRAWPNASLAPHARGFSEQRSGFQKRCLLSIQPAPSSWSPRIGSDTSRWRGAGTADDLSETTVHALQPFRDPSRAKFAARVDPRRSGPVRRPPSRLAGAAGLLPTPRSACYTGSSVPLRPLLEVHSARWTRHGRGAAVDPFRLARSVESPRAQPRRSTHERRRRREIPR